MNHEPEMFDLIREASSMLLDRSKPERDLIYYIAKMEPDLRAAIIWAYECLKQE